MEAIKKIAYVKNHTLTLELPESFNHPQVEVIVLPYDTPAVEPENVTPTWQQDFSSISCWSD